MFERPVYAFRYFSKTHMIITILYQLKIYIFYMRLDFDNIFYKKYFQNPPWLTNFGCIFKLSFGKVCFQFSYCLLVTSTIK